ncbi:MAG: hypothetical protein AAF958_05180 [Planctomycetota bacterium]
MNSHRHLKSQWHRKCRTSRGGLTLVEVLVSVLLISGLLIGSIAASTGLSERRARLEQDENVETIFASIFDELRNVHFEDPESPVWGPEPGETTRADFDDLDDFDGQSWLEPLDRQGRPFRSASGWRIDLAVEVVQANLRRVRVTHTAADGTAETRATVVGRLSDAPEPRSVHLEALLDITLDGQNRQQSQRLMNRPTVNGAGGW